MKQFLLITGVMIALLLVARNWPVHDPGLPDDQWFDANVATRSELVLVKFGAEWCGYCVAMDQPLDALERSHRDRLHVVRVDTVERPTLAKHYGIDAIPRSLLFREGKVIADRTGFMNATQLKQWVDEFQ